MAIAKPPSDMRLAEMPSLFIAMKVKSGVNTKVATTISDERTSPKNKNKMITTKITPSIKTFVTVHKAASTNSERS